MKPLTLCSIAFLLAATAFAGLSATAEEVAGKYQLVTKGLKAELERQVNANLVAMANQMPDLPAEVRDKFAERALSQVDLIAKNFRIEVELAADGSYTAEMTGIVDGKPESATGRWAVQGDALQFVSDRTQAQPRESRANGTFGGDHIVLTLGDGRMPMHFRLDRIP